MENVAEYAFMNGMYKYIHDSKQRKKRGIFYAMIIAIVFIGSHYMAANYIEEPAGLFPPYVEKKIAFPELYEKKK